MFDENCAYLTDEDGNRYQVLKPATFAIDPATGEEVALPREWDEAATFAIMHADKPTVVAPEQVDDQPTPAPADAQPAAAE